jgi:hypothetical protein
MFVCKDCEKEKMEYCGGIMRSVGLCEICERQADCLDARVYKMRVDAETATEAPSAPETLGAITQAEDHGDGL